jgi:hypothetical protein
LRSKTAVVTSNLPFDEWTSVFGSERLTGALLDRLTHHVHILEINRRKLSACNQQKGPTPTRSGAERKHKTPAEGAATTEIKIDAAPQH